MQVSGGEVFVNWPDGTLARYQPDLLRLVLSASRKGKLEGLIGNFDGDPANDVRVRGGRTLNASLDGLYDDFKSSWRVALDAPASLFRSGPDPWDPAFPSRVVTLADFATAAVDQARTTCRAAGVTTSVVVDGCALDLLVTNDQHSVQTAVAADPAKVRVTVSPTLSYLMTGGSRAFTATVSGTANQAVTWSASGGTFVPAGANGITYTAPSTPGEYVITARSAQDGSAVATAQVVVSGPGSLSFGTFDAFVGAGLRQRGTIRLSVPAPDGGAVLTMTSSDPTRVRVAPAGNATAATQAMLTIPAGGTLVDFAFDGMEGQQGVASLRVSAPDYDLQSLDVEVRPTALVLIPPVIVQGQLADLTPMGARVCPSNAAGTDAATVATLCAQVIRPGGSPMAVTFTSSDASVGEVSVVGSQIGPNVTANIPVGALQTPATGLGAVQFVPGGTGTTTLRVSAANAVSGPAASAVTAIVAPPLQIMRGQSTGISRSGISVGIGLRSETDIYRIALPGPAPAGGVQLTLTSRDPGSVRVAVATARTALPAAQSNGAATVTVPAGGTDAYFAVDVASNTIVGAQSWIVASAPGYARDSSYVVALAPRFTIDAPAEVVLTQATAPIGVRVCAGFDDTCRQAVAPGATGLSVVLTSETPTVGRFEVEGGGSGAVVTAAIAPGAQALPASGTGSVRLRLLTSGQTTLRVNNEAGTGVSSPVQVRVSNPAGFRALTAGYAHTCGLGVDGRAYCWGDNYYGQLGDGTTVQRLVPTLVAGGLTFTALSAGVGHTCGLATDGRAYCWGVNASGQLGDGTTTRRLVPTAVAGGITFSALAAGGRYTNGPGNESIDESFTCGLSSDGLAYCWGSNSWGQLGDGTASLLRLVPTAVAQGLNFSLLRVGAMHTCGLARDGRAYCWGANVFGELGDGTFTLGRGVPAPVAGGLTFTSLTAGEVHTCGVSDGMAYCWGDNRAGQLGDGTSTEHNTPNPVPVNDFFLLVRAGAAHTCGLSTGGRAYCWGANLSGELGIGTSSLQELPTPVAGSFTFTALAIGSAHSCGLLADGRAFCWGDGQSGQLGDGTTEIRLAPTTPVAGGGTSAVRVLNALTSDRARP